MNDMGTTLITSNTPDPEHKSRKTKTMSTSQRPVRRDIALTLAAGLLIVVAFQAALTLGAPFGAAAQGGTNPGRLPDELRVASGIGALIFLFASLVVLARGGRNLIHLPAAMVRVGTWVIVALLGVGALLNFASSSPWERYGWGPFTLVLLVMCVVLARSGAPGRKA
jgi:hypothetical protein